MNNWIIWGVVFVVIGYIFTGIGYVKQLKEGEKDKIELDNFRNLSLSNDTIIIKHTQLNSEKTDDVYKEVIESKDILGKNFQESNNYNLKKLKSESPYIEVLSNTIQFRPDDDGTEYRIVFTNTKSRDAINVEFEAFFIFRNADNTGFGDYYNANQNNGKIDRIIKDHPVGTGYNVIILPYDTFLKVANGGLILINMKFYDEILREYVHYKLYYKLKLEKNRIVVYLGDEHSKTDIENFMKEIKYKSKL
jgi:hypothetical protein